MEDFRNNNIKQEGEERFRCNICNKLFKAEHFVQKHITNRHAPEMEVVMQEVRYRFTVSDGGQWAWSAMALAACLVLLLIHDRLYLFSTRATLCAILAVGE